MSNQNVSVFALTIPTAMFIDVLRSGAFRMRDPSLVGDSNLGLYDAERKLLAVCTSVSWSDERLLRVKLFSLYDYSAVVPSVTGRHMQHVFDALSSSVRSTRVQLPNDAYAIAPEYAAGVDVPRQYFDTSLPPVLPALDELSAASPDVIWLEAQLQQKLMELKMMFAQYSELHYSAIEEFAVTATLTDGTPLTHKLNG